MTYQSINPFNGEKGETFKKLSDAQLEQAVSTAQGCFSVCKHKTYAERAVVLEKAASLMRGHVDDFAKLATL